MRCRLQQINLEAQSVTITFKVKCQGHIVNGNRGNLMLELFFGTIHHKWDACDNYVQHCTM